MPTAKKEVQVYPEPSEKQKARRQPIVFMLMLIFPRLRQIRAKLTKEQRQPALLLVSEVDRAVPQEERGHGDDERV
jgi:hypothetical protein